MRCLPILILVTTVSIPTPIPVVVEVKTWSTKLLTPMIVAHRLRFQSPLTGNSSFLHFIQSQLVLIRS